MRLPRPSPYRSLTLVVLLLILAVILFLLDQAQLLGPVRNYAQSLLSPVMGTLSRAGEGIGGFSLGEAQTLRAEIAALEEEVSQLRTENIRTQAMQEEIQRLRQQLGIEQARPWKLLGAEVVAHTPEAGRRVLLLSVGSNDKVKPGMAVISKLGRSPEALIGVVEEVGPTSAKVLLITDFSSSISATVYHEGQVASGVVHGQFQRGAWLRLEQLDRADPVAAGDVVVTAGLTAQLDLDLPLAALPRNIPIGVVEEVHMEGHNQMANVRPYLDPDQVRYAWVILNQDD